MPSIRSLLAATTPNAPYAPEVTREQLLQALTDIADGNLAGGPPMFVARTVLKQDRINRAWTARAEALQTAYLRHAVRKGGADFCRCKSCAGWREERRAMFEAKAAAQGTPSAP